jgi:hypothetical protein
MIGETMCYPPLIFQSETNKKLLEESCKIVRIIFDTIGSQYDKLRDIYNAYKHGYRIVPCRTDGKLSFLYFDETDIPKFLQYDDNDIKRTFELAADCRRMIENIVENQKTRMRVGDSDSVSIKINLFTDSKEPINIKNLEKIFYNKRIDMKKNYAVEKEILKNSGNIENYRYNWVLFDVKDKKILAFNQELIEIIKKFYELDPINEISVLKIGNKFIDSIG